MKNKLYSTLKTKLKNLDRFHIMLIAIMLFSALFLIYLTTLKEGMHVDEYLTYGLANNEADNANKIQPEYGVRLDATDVFDTFFYADGFSLRNVWLNQGRDVHPPLFYLCFHIFTLLTHHFLALKTGILLNIIFHMINIGLVWLILKEILNNDYEIVMGEVLYAFMPIILGNVLFIRMYVMLSTLILCLTLLFVKELNKDNQVSTSGKRAFYIKLGVISVVGTLTHYYFLIYLFFCCVVWGIYILIKRRWKELIAFVVTMAISAGISIAVFPYMLEHIFSGYRGEESFQNLTKASVFEKNIKTFWGTLNNVYGGFLLAVIIAAILICIVMKYLIMDRKKVSIQWTIICIPCILYVLTIARISSISASRYIAPIYAVCIILLMGLFDKAVSYIADSKFRYIASILLVCILLNNGYKTYTWTELYLDAESCISEARKYGINSDCIYVMNLSWHSFTAYPEFIQYQNMTFIRDNHLELLYTEDFSNYDHVVMYFDKSVGEENINDILDKMIEMNPNLDEYEELHEWSYNRSYYLD